MIDKIRQKATELLASGSVNVVIGYGNGTGKKIRPVFVRKPEETNQLIFDQRCVPNLAVYLLRPEIKALGKIALVARIPVIRAVIQLVSENQVGPEDVTIIGISAEGEMMQDHDLKSLEPQIAAMKLAPYPTTKEKLDDILKMSPPERWNFWAGEISRCIKCYACRSSCPLCYCSRCTVECNQPQWIGALSHPLGNLEWHVMRAMHLADRCVNCGACAHACPMEIPVNILCLKLSEEVFNHFGSRAGTQLKRDHALSSFKPEDEENFIK